MLHFSSSSRQPGITCLIFAYCRKMSSPKKSVPPSMKIFCSGQA
jgi:hypothetical protein